MRESRNRFLVRAGAFILIVATASSVRAQYDTYIRAVAFQVPGNETVLLRWPEKKMPLRVYLGPPPEGLFADAKPVEEAVRRGVLDWTDVVKKGVPSFKFVESIGDADIPIVWTKEPDGHWNVARCVWNIQPFARRFGVSRIWVTGRWTHRLASPEDIYRVVLHEMGHALGLAGHSSDPGDIMFGPALAQSLSERDKDTLKELYSRPIGSRITGARRGIRRDR